MARAMTVNGPVEVDELGPVLMHEHLLHDGVDTWFAPIEGPEGEGLADAPLTMDVLGLLFRAPHVIKENIRLTRSDPIVDELKRYAAAGGGTLVELTVRGMNPDPEGVREISRAAGVHVVAGCGWYVDDSHPPEVENLSVDELSVAIVSDLRDGIDGTDVRAGIIGEIGVSERMTAREEKCLRAAAQAAVETGAAVTVHFAMRGRQAPRAVAVLTGEGVPADRIVLDHVDEENDVDYSKQLCDLGCVVEYDTFGAEWYFDTYDEWIDCEPRDTERVAGIAALCEQGYASQLAISHDVYFKRSLRAFGGLGYDHIATAIVPMLKAAGVGTDELNQILVETPKRLLAIPEV
jgi:phosphotriesterase-related protein